MMRPVANVAISPKRIVPMSSSNLAVRMDHTATDLLSHPPRSVRVVTTEAANEAASEVRSLRPRISFTNRKFVSRDQGLRLFRIR
jgi:hypothetical protein